MANLFDRAVATAGEIGRSLAIAGRSLMSAALRVARMAEAHLEAFWAERSDAATANRTASWPLEPPSSRTSALALDDDLPVARSIAGAPPPVALTNLRDHERNATELPERYGVDRLSLAARDPETIFAWWEVTATTRARAARELEVRDGEAASGDPTNDALRITVDGEEAGTSWTIPLPAFARSWYVSVPRDSHRFRVELGLFRRGEFVALLAPAIVTTPQSEPSTDRSVRWRQTGDERAVVAPIVPPEESVDWLWRDVQGLPGSHDWPAHRRAPELGSSSGLPIA